MQPVRILCIAAVALSAVATASAQTYPAKPLKIVVSTSAGGITDITARILGHFITAKTGQTVVIENRAGASGNIAMEAVAKSPADGYTLGFANTGQIVINPHVMKNMPYDPTNDLVPVGPVGTVPLFLVVNSALPVKTVPEFVAHVKKLPEGLSYASAGAGTTPDLAAHAFARIAGLKFVFVPFRGMPPAMTAVVAGDVPAMFISMGPYMGFVREGKIRILGIAQEKRVAYLPDVPTFAEQGFAEFTAGTWFALFAPRGTPKEIVEQLNGYVRALYQDPDAKKRLEGNFVDPYPLTAAEFGIVVNAETRRWGRVIRDAGIKVQ
jgi:tripartite-type tricarboxylate transporter receptor subunit TctC